jgi:hypothetical protein
MPKSTFPAAAIGLPAETDEVLALAEKVQWLWNRETQLEKNESDARKSRGCWNYYENAGHDVYDQRRILRDVISMTKATSLAGAAVQISEILARVEELMDTLGVDETYEIQKAQRAIKRLAYSALDVVDAASDQRLETVYPFFSSPNFNPWIPVEDRIEQMDTERSDADV